ncbi:MAG: PLP-dependent aminotransferase family protein [Eubacterium sp.]|nr:PLP-dependent aminotransferase family protein [Eubacterium sp.]
MFEEKISELSLATPASFIRAILKTTESSEVISFAGGLPNPISFPKEEIKESTNRVIDEYGSKVFQYSLTAGLRELREYIAEHLNETQGMDVTPDEIIVTTGSQQALDLIGKVFINPGDRIIMEEPAYLGAIQAFSQYRPEMCAITLESDGMDMEKLEEALKESKAKFIYTVPNFQNPSGLTYSGEKRETLHRLSRQYNCILIEDDPYGDLKFDGNPYGYISKGEFEGSILLGTFSKTVTPGMRSGFMVIRNEELRLRINTAKEAADLHSNVFSQYILWDYLTHNDVQQHILKIRELYRKQSNAMIRAMESEFPETVSFTRPEGGMFIWATLPENMIAFELFEKARQENVVFVPGNPFYIDGRAANTMRLNYTNCDEETITEGIRRLAKLIKM